MSEIKKNISLDYAIELLNSNIEENEKLYEEVHERFAEKIDSKNFVSQTSDSRSAVEFAKTLSSIRSVSVTGAKALVDAVEKKELLELKKKSLEIEGQNSTDIQELLRKAISENIANKKEAITKYTSSDKNNNDIAINEKELLNFDNGEDLDKILDSKVSLTEGEKKIVSRQNKMKEKTKVVEDEDISNGEDDPIENFLDLEN